MTTKMSSHETSQIKAIKHRKSNPLRLFKSTFFNGSNKINAKEVGKDEPSVKLRRSDIEISKKIKPEKRFSAQRVSLFKYKYVLAFNCTSSSGRRKDSGSSGITYVSSKITGDSSSERSNKSSKSISLKNCSLMSNGPLEIYQIITPTVNPTEKPQTMNYITFGRDSKIVHAILPKLKVTKVKNEQNTFCISLFNPKRQWRIEFQTSPRSKKDQTDLNSIISNFESIISGICTYTSEDEPSVKSLNSTVVDADVKLETFNTDESEKLLQHVDDIDDALNYLLIEDNDEVEKQDDGASISAVESNYTKDNRTNYNDNDTINFAFKTAIRNMAPQNRQINSLSAETSRMSIRNSSYYSSAPDLWSPLTQRSKRRSITSFFYIDSSEITDRL